MKPVHSKYYLLYFPWLLSMILANDPVVSYFIAWGGSLYIFYLTFTNKINPTLSTSWNKNLLQPLFLMQIIFAGYMSCSSIFYFMDLLGYEYTSKSIERVAPFQDIADSAACQRYYILGHAAMVHAMLLFYNKKKEIRYVPVVKNWPLFFLKIVFICIPLSFILLKVPGFSVLANSAQALAFVAATLALAIAIPFKKPVYIISAGLIYIVQIFQALTSGFKEPVIISVLMLGLFLYPYYKRLISLIFLPLLIFLFAVLPTYVNTFRSQRSAENAIDAETAKTEALQKVKEDLAGDQLAKTNWDFLTNRISEIGMFVKYKQNMDKESHYYGVQILKQSAVALVPRALWPSKPITEEVAMERVIQNGIVEDMSVVSAKPQYLVDGYLSFGLPGIWLALFFYGMLAQLINNKAEELFGGYFLGTAFVYTGLFRVLWRGNCFEFIFNDIFWNFIGMISLFYLFKKFKIIRTVN